MFAGPRHATVNASFTATHRFGVRSRVARVLFAVATLCLPRTGFSNGGVIGKLVSSCVSNPRAQLTVQKFI